VGGIGPNPTSLVVFPASPLATAFLPDTQHTNTPRLLPTSDMMLFPLVKPRQSAEASCDRNSRPASERCLSPHIEPFTKKAKNRDGKIPNSIAAAEVYRIMLSKQA